MKKNIPTNRPQFFFLQLLLGLIGLALVMAAFLMARKVYFMPIYQDKVIEKSIKARDFEKNSGDSVGPDSPALNSGWKEYRSSLLGIKFEIPQNWSTDPQVTGLSTRTELSFFQENVEPAKSGSESQTGSKGQTGSEMQVETAVSSGDSKSRPVLIVAGGAYYNQELGRLMSLTELKANQTQLEWSEVEDYQKQGWIGFSVQNAGAQDVGVEDSSVKDVGGAEDAVKSADKTSDEQAATAQAVIPAGYDWKSEITVFLAKETDQSQIYSFTYFSDEDVEAVPMIMDQILQSVEKLTE